MEMNRSISSILTLKFVPWQRPLNDRKKEGRSVIYDQIPTIRHRCDKRLQRLQKILCKRVYYFVNVYVNKNHMSETKQNYNGKPSYSALVDKLEEIPYSETTVPWFEQREFISDSDSDEDH